MTARRSLPNYCAQYCEENVWHLCGELGPEVEEAYAVFVSNRGRRVAVWCQRSKGSPDEPQVWDYHVLLLERRGGEWRVTDLDSTLGTDVPAAQYLARSFRPLPRGLAHMAPRFRLVPAAEYRERLRSDRSHMLSPTRGWLSPPPPWPCIGCAPGEEGTNLMRFVDLDDSWLGEVHDLPSLRRRLGVPEEDVPEKAEPAPSGGPGGRPGSR